MGGDFDNDAAEAWAEDRAIKLERDQAHKEWLANKASKGMQMQEEYDARVGEQLIDKHELNTEKE